MLADMGADVVRVDRPTTPDGGGVLGRNRRSIALDLKADSGRSLLFELIRRADGLVEAFRPGVAERLGFGPESCHAENPRLVFGRATGWGQEGPWRMMAGHDINYIALSGVLSMIGPKGGAPVPPLNLVGDFGGGGLLLAFGMVCALLEARTSGVGQVVDGAMVDGSALLASMFFEMTARHRWSDERGTNVLDGGAPYYDTYETSDGKWVAVGAVEPQFWGAFIEMVGIDAYRAPRPGRRGELAHTPPADRRRHRHSDPGRMGRAGRRHRHVPGAGPHARRSPRPPPPPPTGHLRHGRGHPAARARPRGSPAPCPIRPLRRPPSGPTPEPSWPTGD